MTKQFYLSTILLLLLLMPVVTPTPLPPVWELSYDYDYDHDVYIEDNVKYLTYEFNYSDIPSTALVNESYWLVSHGYSVDLESVPYNISLSECYNGQDNMRFRMVSNGRLSPDWQASSVYCHNTTDWVRVGEVYNGSGSADSGTQNDNFYLLAVDNVWGTGVCKGQENNLRLFNADNPSVCRQATIYEQAVYWYHGEVFDILFLVKDEFGRVVTGADINVTRVEDDLHIGLFTTDISGSKLIRLNKGKDYNLSITKDGYESLIGVISVSSSSYTLTLSTVREPLEVYYGVFNGVQLITSPAIVDSVPTNFSIQVSANNSDLELWGVRTDYDGTLYQSNSSVAGGGTTYITVDLTNKTDTITLEYFFKKFNQSVYVQTQVFKIGIVDDKSTSVVGLIEQAENEWGSIGRGFMAFAIIILVIIMVSAIGVPGDWAAGVGVFPLALFGYFGWVNPLLAGMTSMVIIGIIMINNRPGG